MRKTILKDWTCEGNSHRRLGAQFGWLKRRSAIVFSIAFSLMGLTGFSQPIIEFNGEKMGAEALKKLYLSAQRKLNASSNLTDQGDDRKLIVVNPETLDNVVLSWVTNGDDSLKVTPLLVAELNNAGLERSETYDCIVADVTSSGEYDCRKIFKAEASSEVKMPLFRYGRKGDVRLASYRERLIKSVGLNVPMPLFGTEISEEEFRREFERNRQMALANGWYTYEYVLPNGDLTTYADFGDSVSDPDKSDMDATGTAEELGAGVTILDWTGKISTYNVEPLSPEAKVAMLAGAQTWNDVLSMKIPVIAKVGFTGDYEAGSSTLGSSFSPATYTISSTGIAYPAALIDQILGENMHPSSDYDIRIIYNKDFLFYFGTDGNCPSTKHDFQSIVTHELCHGLGFTSYHYRGPDSVSPDGSWSTSGNVPSVFDTFLYYGSGRLPTLSQSVRKSALTSNALYWDGEWAKVANGNSRIKMYAPTSYKNGSSVSHWDDSVTFATFMKRSTSRGEVHHDVDSRLIGAFKDMGWTLKVPDPVPTAAPVNDNFANATAISGASGSLTASSENATMEAGEPYHGTSSAINSVWWKWTASAAGDMTITTEGSGFDTGLGIYTGNSVSALTKITSNDDEEESGQLWSSVTFSVSVGTTYYIAVAGYKGATGSVKLNWSYTGTETPTTYSITYALGGGTHGATHPTSATYGTAFYVSAPTRSGYTFAGWTVTSGLNTSTAKWGTSSNPSTAIGSLSTKCVNGATGNVYFKNLTSTANGSVTLTANWTSSSDFTYDVVGGTAVIKKYTGSGSTVVIPSTIDGYTVTALADYAFHQSAITSITLPDSLTKMGWFSLANCRNLTTIHLPANVAQFTSRQYAPFGGNTSQTAFTVASGNTHFTAVDGVLFTKDMKELISFPAGKNVERYDIPSSVTNIWGCAFDSCKYLATVTIPEGVSTLMYCAFESSAKLASVSLPESLRTIDYYVFQGCSSLKSLTIPAGVTCMGYNALNTSSLTKLVLLGRSGAKYAGTFDYAAEKWGASIANANIWVMPDDYDYWTAILGEGLSVIGAEEPQTYSVIYNCGTYGSGVQQSATKTQGAALTLKGAIFTRTGYTQTGWSTSAAGSTKAYNLGASYTTDAAITLYPFWTANTYSITYALGGGTHGTTHPASATYDTAFYISAPTRSGYTFAGWTVTSGLNTSTAKWGTSSSPSTTISSPSTKCLNGTTGNVYFKNLTLTANGSVTLTANWTAVIPLSTALDNTTLTFTTGGDAGWSGQSANTHDGTDAARSGAITHNQNSWMQTTVTGPGTISFWWYASCEGSTYDYLSFSVDGVQTNKIGGTSCSWTQCSYALAAGTHTLKWNYRKDGSVNSGFDAGFVDQVTWSPGTPVPTTYQVTFVKGVGIGAVYYRLGSSGSWTLYTVPFSVEKDAVVYYYVTPLSGYTVSYSSANPVHVTITGIATINVSAAPIPKTLYVAVGGSDAQSGAEGAPLATIQAAIDRAPEDSVILVGPGVYAPISTEGKRIVIRGVEGPAQTVIDGGGTNRCAHLGLTTSTVLDGITLRNGAAGYRPWAPGHEYYQEEGGGSFGGTLLNCHVVNCKAGAGGGTYRSVLSGCMLFGNAAASGGGGSYFDGAGGAVVVADRCVYRNNSIGTFEGLGSARGGSAVFVRSGPQVTLQNCIIAENVVGGTADAGAVYSIFDDECMLRNCTVVNNRGGWSGPGAAGVSAVQLVNSIVYFNVDRNGQVSNYPERYGRTSISGSCVYPLPDPRYNVGSGNISGDPRFVDPTHGIYRLMSTSPCLNMGVTVSDVGDLDALGNPRLVGAAIDIGACEGAANGYKVHAEVEGLGAVAELGDVVAVGGSKVFTAVELGRRFEGFLVNGVFATTNNVLRLSNIGVDLTVTAVFAHRTVYVNASRPDDSEAGASWATAKRTIGGAMEGLFVGDTVYVTNGVYDAFSVRVAGVKIRSVNGPQATFVDGGGKSRCATFGYDTYETESELEGFTLRNGRTTGAGGGAYGGHLKRCIVRDCSAGTSGGGVYQSIAENTIIVRNSSETFGGGAAYATLVNCSVAGNRTNGEKGGGLYLGQAVNSVVWGNEANGTTDEYSGGSFTNCVTSPLPSGAGNRSGDPRLVDAVNGDVRLRTGSSLKDTGNSSFVAGALDVLGNARVQGLAVDVGAIEGGEVSGHVISVRVKGVGDVSPRTAVVSDGGSVTLTAVETSRPFSYYLLYGLKFSGREQTLTDLMSDLTVTAVFTPYTFYVDATAKTSGDGLSWAAAKRTIQEAVDVAEVDETVRVAPGTYPPISTHNKRVVIESEKGPAVTVIDGGQTNRCATLADNSSGHATVLRGFTLTHGVLKGTDVYGGGAYAGTLDRCIVSNCQLLSAASSSWGQGAGLAYSKAVNTLIVNNVASNSSSYAGTYYADLKNCTVAGNRAVSGTWQYGGTYYGTADNCIIWGNEGGDRNNSYGTTLKYCCVDSSSTSRGTGCVVADPQFVDAASGDYRLAIGSPCIDAGLLGGADVGEVDLDGLARVVNGAIDIGAYEWQNGVVIPRSSEAAVVIPLDWFSTGKIGGASVFSPSNFAALFGTDYAIAAKTPTGKVDAHGNPMYVWQDFVAGTDPTDKTSEFKASISFVGGEPVISWTPDLNEGGTKSLRTYRTLGISDLSQSADPTAWREVAPGNESAYKFFKVEVDLK